MRKKYPIKVCHINNYVTKVEYALDFPQTDAEKCYRVAKIMQCYEYDSIEEAARMVIIALNLFYPNMTFEIVVDTLGDTDDYKNIHMIRASGPRVNLRSIGSLSIHKETELYLVI